jgi:hypothetical protein
VIVSINQPAYLPWLGYFDRIFKSDIHVVLDHVQFEKNSMVNRNKIKSNQQAQMLTIPLRTKGRFGNLEINSLEVADNVSWRIKHYRSIDQAYSKSSYKDTVLGSLAKLYDNNSESALGPILRSNLEIFLELLSLKDTTIMYSSEMNCRGHNSDLILNICRDLRATCYISGPFGRQYLDADKFEDSGINVIYHDYKHPTYMQGGPNFLSHLSTLDLLMNHGEQSLEILTSQGNYSFD